MISVLLQILRSLLPARLQRCGDVGTGVDFSSFSVGLGSAGLIDDKLVQMHT